MQSCPTDRPLIELQQSQVERCVSLATQLVKCRAESLSWHAYAPGSFAAFLNDESSAGAMDEFKLLLAA
eukprot:2167068-Amphidinium_carterae.1